MKSRLYLYLLVLGLSSIILLGLYLILIADVAQAEGEWNEPDTLFSVSQDEWVIGLKTIADQMGNLHAFWVHLPYNPSISQGNQETHAIYYSVWDGQKWSEPVDILTSPGEDFYAADPAVAIDSAGKMHIVWAGRDLYYSSAFVSEARSAHGWSQPISIADSSFEADILVDQDDVIHVVYPAVGERVYSIQSQDGGISWSYPIPISNSNDSRATVWTRLALDSLGGIHLVWQENPLPEAYPPAGVYYAKSLDGGNTWSDPVKLAGEHFGLADIAVDGENAIHVVWEGDATTKGRYHVYSLDGGNSWSQPYDLTQGKGRGGLVRPPAMAVDGQGTLHLVIADAITTEIEKTGIGGALYTYWLANEWAPLFDVSGNIGASYGEGVTLEITNGNTLHIMVPPRHQVWHSYKELPFLPMPTIMYPTIVHDDVIAFATQEAQITTAPKTPLEEFGSRDDEVNTGVGKPLFVGLLPVILLLGILLVSRLSRLK